MQVRSYFSQPWYWYLAFALFLLPIAFYLWTIVAWGVNIPYQDDFDAIFGWLKGWNETNSTERLGLLFSQHNEHRIVVSRLILLAFRGLFGSIWLPGLMLVGGVFLIVFFILLYRSLSFKQYLCFLFPLSYFFFVPHYAEATYWAMASLSNFGVLFLAGTSLWFLQKKNGKMLAVAILLAILATFSNGNGIFVFPAGILVLLVQKRWKDMGYWILIFLLSAGTYFYHYVPPPYHTSLLSSFSDIWRLVLYFFAFLGNAFAFGFRQLGFSIYAGITICIAWLYLIYKRYYQKQPFLSAISLFILLSTIATALSRNSFGIEQAVSSRYRINSIILLAILFLAYFDSFHTFFLKKWVQIGTIVICISYGLLSYVAGYAAIAEYRSQLLQRFETTPVQWIHPMQKHAQEIMEYSRVNGIWNGT